eukprot:CAMPEP_0117551822 /NCGR_PEP_ID=MMETSP0784-20121206/49387_1 /TAXON_ID=39447 /ORGANISM="" /LENGTH=484 /DNA_ID=CAMNT_0005348869 /DNA_START=80 /DNA_END=1531 /DNA_ORIENTATION=-
MTSCICDTPQDKGKTPVVALDGANVLCGEDAAMAAARIATSRRTGLTECDEVLKTALGLDTALKEQAAAYTPPDILDAGTKSQRPRELTTLGEYSRRASNHSLSNEYAPAVADLLRALLRPSIDKTIRAKLMSKLTDCLKKAKKDRDDKAAEGDLSYLLDDLEIEEDQNSLGDIDDKVLKKRYRELSIKYHPDKSKDAAERFNRVRDAYEILSDPVKVLLYDTGGLELVKKFEGGKGDIERTDNVEIERHLTLQQVYSGHSEDVTYERTTLCRSCRTQPNLPRCKRCRACKGRVEERQVWMNQHQFRIEHVEIPSNEKCLKKVNKVAVAFEKGMMTGDRVHYPHLAEQRPKHIPGDLLVTVRIAPHRFFKRVGNDLSVTVKVTLYEALLGFERELVHLDGHLVKFSIDRGTVLRPGFGMVIEGEGMPLREDPSSYGKLLVKFELEFPKTIPDELYATLESVMREIGQGPGPTRVQTTRADARSR